MTRGEEYVAGSSDTDANDFFWIDIQNTVENKIQLTFGVNDKRGYRLINGSEVDDISTLLEDFGEILGNHEAQVILEPAGKAEFYQLEAYLP